MSHTFIKFFFAISALAISACSHSLRNSENNHHEIVGKWLGKEIHIPKQLKFQIIDSQLNFDFNDADFKILTYIDSTGCSYCRMKLSEWDALINKLKATPDASVNFVMILNATNPKSAVRQLKKIGFYHPVILDENNEFADNNPVPNDIMCQTFLLDADNRIIAVGNPVLNPKVEKLYYKIISGNSHQDKDTIYQPTCYTPSIPLGVIKHTEDKNIEVDLYNNDSLPLHIEGIIPSCDCLSAQASRDIINPMEHIKLNVRFNPTDSIGIYHQTLNLFFKEREYPETITFHGYIN